MNSDVDCRISTEQLMKGVDASKKKPPSFGLKSRSLVSNYGAWHGGQWGAASDVGWKDYYCMGCLKMGSADWEDHFWMMQASELIGTREKEAEGNERWTPTNPDIICLIGVVETPQSNIKQQHATAPASRCFNDDSASYFCWGILDRGLRT